MARWHFPEEQAADPEEGWPYPEDDEVDPEPVVVRPKVEVEPERFVVRQDPDCKAFGHTKDRMGWGTCSSCGGDWPWSR
jgi:hypothetical protein